MTTTLNATVTLADFQYPVVKAIYSLDPIRDGKFTRYLAGACEIIITADGFDVYGCNAGDGFRRCFGRSLSDAQATTLVNQLNDAEAAIEFTLHPIVAADAVTA